MSNLVPALEPDFNGLSLSSGAPVAPKSDREKKLPSKAARNKKRDSHRAHLNKKTMDITIKNRLDAKRHFPEEDLAAVLEECRRTAMQQPAKEVAIQVNEASIYDLCTETVGYLYNVGKIAPADGGQETDVRNLTKVVMAQAVAKVHIARQHNGKLVETADVEYITRVEKRFTVLPKVLNIYLEQIGQFTCDGQTFIPKSLPPLRFQRLRSGAYLTSLERHSPMNVREIALAVVGIGNESQYVRDGVFIGDVIQMVTSGHGTITWVRADSLSDFPGLSQWYEGFISRCNRKASGLLQNVVFKGGEGTVAQLVGSFDDPRTMQREVWCNKVIDQNILQIGALFGYGLNSMDPFHSELIAAVTDRIEMPGLYQRIQRCQRL